MNNILSRGNRLDSIKFKVKEYIKIYTPKINKVIADSNIILDNVIEYYTDYPYSTLFILWVISTLLIPEKELFITTVILITALLTIINTLIRNKHEEFYLTTDFSKVMNELDGLIADCIQEYIAMNALENKRFFSIDEEKRLREETTNMASAKISKILYNKLCLAYNKDVVYDVIGSRIYLIVSKFIYETNTKPNFDKKK